MNLFSTSSKWFSRRKIITPTFHFNILKGYREVFVAQGRVSKNGKAWYNFWVFRSLWINSRRPLILDAKWISSHSSSDARSISSVVSIPSLLLYFSMPSVQKERGRDYVGESVIIPSQIKVRWSILRNGDGHSAERAARREPRLLRRGVDHIGDQL